MENIRANFINELIESLHELNVETPEKFDLANIKRQIQDFNSFWKFSPELIWEWAKEAVQPLVSERTNLEDNKSRNIENVIARSIFANCMRKITKGNASMEMIGNYIEKDHANITHLLKKLVNYSEKNCPHLYACVVRFDEILEERRHLL